MGGRGQTSSGKKKATKMPWETDARYRDNKNAQLLWLTDHPESKYNNPDFIAGIKRIESMSDRGVSAAARKEAFKALIKAHGMTETEGRHFIAAEFLR